MKKLAALTLSLFLVSGTAFADTPKNADAQPAKAQPAKPKAAKKAEKSDAAIAAQLEELRQALQSQQEQLQMLKEELVTEARERLDFFKVLSPPVLRDLIILCRRRASILCKRFLKPVAGLILRL